MIERCGCSSGLLGGELPAAAHLLDERVVLGEAAELAVAEAVGAGVADVGDRDVALADVDGGERRAHAGARVVLARHAEDLLVRAPDDGGEAILGGARLGEPGGDGLDGGVRGDLAGLRAAHAVGDGEHRRARVVGVLVVPALLPGVGERVVFGDAEHQSSYMNVLSPIRMRSPGCSGRGPSSSSSLR